MAYGFRGGAERFGQNLLHHADLAFDVLQVIVVSWAEVIDPPDIVHEIPLFEIQDIVFENELVSEPLLISLFGQRLREECLPLRRLLRAILRSHGRCRREKRRLPVQMKRSRLAILIFRIAAVHYHFLFLDHKPLFIVRRRRLLE